MVDRGAGGGSGSPALRARLPSAVRAPLGKTAVENPEPLVPAVPLVLWSCRELIALPRSARWRIGVPTAAQVCPLAAQAVAVMSTGPAGSRRRHCSRSAARRSGVRDAT